MIITTKYNQILNQNQTYFIADIAANHDGSLDRALELIKLAAKSGANAAKFQNFRAETIISVKGFKNVGKIAHQNKWGDSVFDVYKKAELPIEWNKEIIKCCSENNLDYFTAPYDLNLINLIGDYVPFFKVGSGDIDYKQSLIEMAKYKKPIFLATGASDIHEVKRTVEFLMSLGIDIVLMQCNTNYAGSEENYNFQNLNVLTTYKKLFPKLIMGFSDHTNGHTAVLGAISLGARVIEKHFTDDKNRKGPDHYFSLDPIDWKNMVLESRKLEKALGNGEKIVEDNEKESRLIQRRSLRYKRKLQAGNLIQEEDLIALRPLEINGISPFFFDTFIGKKLKNDVSDDDLVRYEDFE